MDEDRLLELQRNVQEQLHKRDEEIERNIKRVQEFEKTCDFMNSHLLKGVATMAELRQIPDSHWVRLNPQIKW